MSDRSWAALYCSLAAAWCAVAPAQRSVATRLPSRTNLRRRMQGLGSCLSETDDGIALMPWVRLDDSFGDDARVAACALEAFGVLIVSLIWSNRHLSDGWVSRSVMGQRAAPRFEIVESELLRLGFWTAADRNGLPGYQIAADLVSLQPSRDTVERDRAAWRRRQRRSRRRKGAD